MLLQTYLVTIALHWDDDAEVSFEQRYACLEQLRELARSEHLLVQEETRPIAVALFGTPILTVHLGFDQSNLAAADWFTHPDHPYMQAVSSIVDALADWKHITQLEFLISPGVDPMTHLKGRLSRQAVKSGALPSSVFNELQTQMIYHIQR